MEARLVRDGAAHHGLVGDGREELLVVRREALARVVLARLLLEAAVAAKSTEIAELRAAQGAAVEAAEKAGEADADSLIEELMTFEILEDLFL